MDTSTQLKAKAQGGVTSDHTKERLADLKDAHGHAKEATSRFDSKYELSAVQLEKSTKWREAIERAHHQCQEIEYEIAELSAEKHALNVERMRMAKRCDDINARFQEKQREYHFINRDIERKEAEFLFLMEKHPNVADYLKKDPMKAGG